MLIVNNKNRHADMTLSRTRSLPDVSKGESLARTLQVIAHAPTSGNLERVFRHGWGAALGVLVFSRTGLYGRDLVHGGGTFQEQGCGAGVPAIP